jgi:hypothetical protein
MLKNDEYFSTAAVFLVHRRSPLLGDALPPRATGCRELILSWVRRQKQRGPISCPRNYLPFPCDPRYKGVIRTRGPAINIRVHTMKVLSNAKHEAVARALIADPKSVGWRAYKAVYPKSSRHAAETGYTRLSKNSDFAARIDELKAAAAEGAVATARQVLDSPTPR